MRRAVGISAMMLGLALVPEAFGQAWSVIRARLDAIVKAQAEAHHRFAKESIAAGEITWRCWYDG